MERLTKRQAFTVGGVIYAKCEHCQDKRPECFGEQCPVPDEALISLAAYEDTGLEPEEIKQMCALARLNSNIFDNDFGNHIAELIVAEQDGRLLVLPCKVGDTVCAIADCADILKDCDDDYYTGTGAITCPFEKDCDFEECDDANRRVFETYVRSIYKDKGEPINIFLDKIVDRQFYPSDFGKTVFLTRAEAEAALTLKEMADEIEEAT